MVPTFEKFLYPFLLALKDKDSNRKQMVEEMRVYFKLSDEDMNIRTKSGSVPQVVDRTGWALQYLRRAVFVEIKDGKYHITQRGLEFLSSHKDLSINDLLEYKEFAEFSNRKKKSASEPIPQQSVSEQTPTEQLESAFETIQANLAAELLDKVVKLVEAKSFEHLVVELLVAMGYGSKETAKVTQYSHDGGIDGIIYEDQLGLDKIYIQAKHWTKSVGSDEVQKFSGALAGKKANKGIFITTSIYTKSAISYVNSLANQKIILIDGHQLAKLMIQYNIGVQSDKIFVTKKIDNDYFEE